MACFEWEDRKFVNKILCFGLSFAPGVYQMMNKAAVNFLRKNVVKVTLH